MQQFVQKLWAGIMPIIGMIVFIALFIVGIFVFSYVLIIGTVIGLILFIIAFIKAKYAKNKTTTSSPLGRTIEHDDTDKDK